MYDSRLPFQHTVHCRCNHNNILKYIDNDIPTPLNDNKVNEIHEKAVTPTVPSVYDYYNYLDDFYEYKKRKKK